ncbi:ATP-binding protein [Antribacter soli]|uniref:ATP-binding protein n=1 Tax=Antribacter soli TaxID=2910976 RepID=UPI001F22F4C1|nr:ATP-binding protein [Antribacter soli]
MVATAVFVVLAVLKWKQGEQVAGTVSAVCGVLAVGAAVVPLFSRPGAGEGATGRWRVSRTGRAQGGRGSTATTGVNAPADALPGSLKLWRTGSATVEDDGEAHTGVRVVSGAGAGEAATTEGARGDTVGPGAMEVHRSGQVQAGDNSTNITGAVGSVVITKPADVPRPHHTKYLVRVRQLRPEALKERDAELAELSEICTRPDGAAYVWWQAGPWAGKTALMAHFVDNPPDNVRIVSFFIIARDASEADCEAFLELVIPQLAEIAEVPVPANIAGNRKRDFFWELVVQADEACTARGERLVLLVDGLDEDQGVTGSGTMRSIASILPKPAGGSFRVIVAGRQNPPIPADVQADHPLRDPAAVRLLDPSPHGLAIKAQAELQLRAHLEDRGLQHEVLAFVTVARGGLTVADLAELTGETVPHVRGVLHSHSGRAYQLRDQVWSAAEEVMLAHDKLRDAAEEGISRRESTEKLAALVRWAGEYRDRGWPADTPEYLLAGFYRVLLKAGDVVGLVGHVADLARLELLRSATGGDAAGLGQVNATIEHVAKDPADLEQTVLLALVRDHLSDRNGNLPEEVPEVWVRLGDPRRAEALAESSVDPGKQADALGRLVQPLIECGYTDRVGRVVEKACAAAILAGRGWLVDRRLELAERLYATGFREQATDLLRRVCNEDASRRLEPDGVARDLLELVAPESAGELPTVADQLGLLPDALHRVVAVESLVAARARRRDLRSSADVVSAAIAEATSIPEPQDRLRALRGLAGAAVAAGDLTTALVLLDRVTDIARGLPDVGHRMEQLDNAATLACDLNALQKARLIALEARDLADTTTEPDTGSQREASFAWLARRLARTGDVDEALATADRITDLDQRHDALARISATLATMGQVEPAHDLLRGLPRETDVSDALIAVAQHHGAAGRFRAAEAALAAITYPGHRAATLGSIALHAVKQGDAERAHIAAIAAEEIARTVVSAPDASQVLSALGLTRYELGDSEGSRSALSAALHEAHRETLRYTPTGWTPLCRVAATLARANEVDRARDVVEEVVATFAEGLPSGRIDPHSLLDVMRYIAPINPAARAQVIELLTIVLPKAPYVDAWWLALLADAARQYLNPATAVTILDVAVARLDRLSTDSKRAEAALLIADTSIELGLAKQAREYLAAVLTIAKGSLSSERRSLLFRALDYAGGPSAVISVEEVMSHAHASDHEDLSGALAHALGRLGQFDEIRRYRDSLTGDTRRRFTERSVHGLVAGGFTAEALAEYRDAEDAQTREGLVPAAVRAHTARDEITHAVRLVTTTPMTPELRGAILYLCELCTGDDARAVLTLAVAYGPVVDVVDDLAEKLPEVLVANGDSVETIYSVDPVLSP